MKKLRKGQNTLEYVIILAAIIGAIITVALMFGPKLNTSYGCLSEAFGKKVGNVTF